MLEDLIVIDPLTITSLEAFFKILQPFSFLQIKPTTIITLTTSSNTKKFKSIINIIKKQLIAELRVHPQKIYPKNQEIKTIEL